MFTAVLFQAILGLIISLVMKYADNILKGFASAISIILTSFISYIFLHDLQPSLSVTLHVHDGMVGRGGGGFACDGDGGMGGGSHRVSVIQEYSNVRAKSILR